MREREGQNFETALLFFRERNVNRVTHRYHVVHPKYVIHPVFFPVHTLKLSREFSLAFIC